jgi:hypothetical protein
VKKGQTVCIIEAMKLMNEIEVGTGGVFDRQLQAQGLGTRPEVHVTTPYRAVVTGQVPGRRGWAQGLKCT